MNKCENCGSEIIFSPKDKGNVCKNCNSVFPVIYNYAFAKKPFDKSAELADNTLAENLKNIKCNSCGASVLVDKQKLQAKCAYCGDTSIVEDRKDNLMNIDSIIPFSFGKADALKQFTSNVGKRTFANKKIFKDVKEEDINGTYVNAFVFDFSTTTTYNGVFSYTRTVTDKDGKTHTETVRKHVNGVYDRAFKNISIEANSNLTQTDLQSIEPFEYGSAVDFQQDFLNGYMIEYQDKMFNECVKTAEAMMDKDIKRELLRRHGCDRIVSINMSVVYNDKKYNYCLLPVYFVTTIDKKKNQTYKALMNGQTGKVGKLPLHVGKILGLVFGIIGFVVLITLGIVLFT